MYKALHQPSRDEIVIIDPRWKAQIEYLRVLDKQDILVCPGCEAPVRVRAGRLKRPHFAHKHLQNCPFEKESPQLLQTRAVLYDWLIGKFGIEVVSIEKSLGSPTRVRPFDCWVEVDGRSFAYWIFDRLMPPDERQNLQKLCAENNLEVQWIYVMDLLRPDELNPQSRLHLTTTERAFIRQTELDQAWQTHFEHLGGALHYLDPDQGTLISYRNLSLVHKPQLYTGKRLKSSLTDVLVSKITGEFIHQGEAAQLERSQRKMAAQQRQLEERRRSAERFLKGASFSKGSPDQGKTTVAQTAFERKATCRICGTVTSDWITYFGQSNECICRDCKGQIA